ncbi:hypothetical protein ACPF8X_21785 [Streptomyces sp. G35A]
MNDAVPRAGGAEPGNAEPDLAEPDLVERDHAGQRPRPETASADPAGPAPLHVPRTPTGNAEVDAHLERLADADHLTTDGHMEVYEDVHRGLRDALTALDQRGPSGHPLPPAHGHRS